MSAAELNEMRKRGDDYMSYIRSVQDRIDRSEELMKLRQWAVEQANTICAKSADGGIIVHTPQSMLHAAGLILEFVARPLWQVMEEARGEAEKNRQV